MELEIYVKANDMIIHLNIHFADILGLQKHESDLRKTPACKGHDISGAYSF